MTVSIKAFKKIDFQQWMFTNTNNGLSEWIISRKRALAQINNPHLNENDLLLTTAWKHNKCIGYRGVFPQLLANQINQKVAWLTTFYVLPEYRGKGIASLLMQPIVDYYDGKVASLNSSNSAIKVYQKLNWDIHFFERATYYYGLPRKTMTAVSKPINAILKIANRIINPISLNKDIQIRYLCCINESIFEFIKQYSTDLVPKSKDYYNWVITNEWGLEAPFKSNSDPYYFSNESSQFKQYTLSIYLKNQLIGFYVLRVNEGVISVPFLYFASAENMNVFKTILLHAIKLDSFCICTSNDSLKSFLEGNGLYKIKKNYKKISFSHSKLIFQNMESSHIQDGDGDMFF